MRRVLQALRMMRLRELGIARESCPLCRSYFLVRLASTELGVRCPRCGASAVSMSLAGVLNDLVGDLTELDVYELSSAGPLVRCLARTARTLTTSECFDDVPPGQMQDGIQCQDVQRLTFPSAQFDLCTATEVFEHVEDDRAGFRELCRVLRPGGQFIFTVPLGDGATVERTALVDGRRINTLPAEYHADRIRGHRVFVYRDYGMDITERLKECGFDDAHVAFPPLDLFGFSRPVVVAEKRA